MKIVINNCYGGFGLSTEAIMELIKMKSKCINKVTIAHYYGGSKEYIGKIAYRPKWKEDFEKDHNEDRIDLGGKFYSFGRFCVTITDGKYIYNLKDKYENDKIRSNPDLIKVVEELGSNADGDYAELKVIEIPDDIKYQIDEYDGMESIDEKHRSWS